MTKLTLALYLVALTAATTACTQKSKEAPQSKRYFKVTRESFISGKHFCELYDSIGGQKEFGKWIEVPKDYDHPEFGNIQIYAYTNRPFDSAKPTTVRVDGGPGQNTHGLGDFLNDQINEIKFDQRGLGCSTPDTFDQYFDQRLYSSQNTIRDMEEIRKAFGISEWSVYGVSYGTQPATMYASQFPDHLKSVVLEGVIGTPELAVSAKYKAEKWNLVLNSLTPAQKNAIRDLLFEEGPNKQSSIASETIWGLFEDSSYQDNGLGDLREELALIVNEDGKVNRKLIADEYNYEKKRNSQYATVQRPRGVDGNVMAMIDCKEFKVRTVPSGNVSFNWDNGFVVSDPQRALEKANKRCDDVKVYSYDEKPFELKDYSITKPVYYFQGSHDGTCLALGAFEHWKTIPHGETTFMLAKFGGHNPNVTRIGRASTKKKPATREAQQNLMFKASIAASFTNEDVAAVNAAQDDKFDWLIYRGKFDSDVTKYLGGF